MDEEKKRNDSSLTYFYKNSVWTLPSPEYYGAQEDGDKTDINDFTPGLSWINKLRPVTYRWDMRSDYKEGDAPDGTHKKKELCLGLLAQE